MIKQGRILSITPKMENGVHHSYPNKNQPGTVLYVFIADIEGEGRGEFSGAKTTPRWNIGDIVKYEATLNSKNEGGKYFSIKEVVTVGGAPKTGGTSYNDPVNAKRIALSMCDSLSMLTLANLEARGFEVPYKSVADIKTIGKKYYEWVTKSETLTDRDTLSRRWYAINYAVDAIKLKNIFTEMKGVTDKILEIAQEEFDDVMKIQGPAEI